MLGRVACLYGMSENGDWDVKEIEDYLEQDSSAINEGNNGASPLVTALRDHRCPDDVIKVLLKYGAHVNDTRFGFNPLVTSLLFGASKGVIQLLLDAGCSLASCDRTGSVLNYAIKGNGLQKDVLLLLKERGADVNAVDSLGCSAMCYALQRCDSVSTIEMLCEAGVSLSACTNHAHPLLCATQRSITETFLPTNLVEWLLIKAAPFRQINNRNRTPLQRVLRECRYEVGVIHLLLQYFPDVNIVDKFNYNLLHLAFWNISCCDLLTVKLLIKRGVCVNSANKDGKTPLHLAAANPLCSWRIIELLIKSGAAVNAKDVNGETPLEKIVRNEYYYDNWEIEEFPIEILLAAGAHVKLVKNRQSLLQRVFNKYVRNEYHPNYEKVLLRQFKILLQYTLLGNPHFSIQCIIEGHKDYEALSKYWKDCVLELKRMESVTVGESCTMREFLNSYCTPSMEAVSCKPQVRKYNCDQLLRIKAIKVFPLFSRIISYKVVRWFMETKLQEIQLYTMKWSPHKACQDEKVILPYEPVCKIAKYLVDDDLLSFIVAFTCMDFHACGNS